MMKMPEYNRSLFSENANKIFTILWEEIVRKDPHQNEAKELFADFVESVKKIGFLPPVIHIYVRDNNGRHQPIFINLSGITFEEQRLLVSLVSPTVTRSNEPVKRKDSHEEHMLIRKCNEMAITVPSVIIAHPMGFFLGKIYRYSMGLSDGNHSESMKLTKSLKNVFNKIYRQRPIPALKKSMKGTALTAGSTAFPVVNIEGLQKHLNQSRSITEMTPSPSLASSQTVSTLSEK